jgi:hypothetical protein
MYDVKCGELAEHFLADHPAPGPRLTKELAQTIQDAIEDWFAYEESAISKKPD